MGKKLIIKGADFSDVAVSQSPNYEEVVVGTSKNLWSYANTTASGNGYFGFVVPYDCFITGIEFESAATPTGNSYIGVLSEGDTGDDVKYRQMITISSGLNKIDLTNPIPVLAGQCIAVSNTNVLYCDPEVHPGDYQTNNYNGVYMDAPYRCFRLNFIAQKEIV